MAKEKLVTKSGNGVAGGAKSESAKTKNWTTMFTKVITNYTVRFYRLIDPSSCPLAGVY